MVPDIKQANEPNIDKLNKNKTWYIIYDDNGNEIKTSMLEEQPANWYDYTVGQNKWANIMIENDGTIDIKLKGFRVGKYEVSLLVEE